MSTAERSSRFSPRTRNINNVQRVLRTLIWLGLFSVLGVLTLVLALLLNAVHPALGLGALVVLRKRWK